MDATVATVETVELMLRIAAVLITGIAAGFIWVQVARRRIRPRLIWIYVGVVLTAAFLWRGVILAMAFVPGLRESMVDWITPITAASYCLGALSTLMLAFCDSRRRRGDE